MGVFSGNPKDQPLHIGEAFDLYTALTIAQSTISTYQLYFNHAGDPDLKSLLKDIIEMDRENAMQLQKPLKANGVPLPPAPAERPSVDVDMIPAGAKFTDQEIAMRVQADTAGSLVAISQAMGKTMREDLAMIYVKMHQQGITVGARLLQLMKEKNWIVPPPPVPEVKEVALV